MTMGRSGDDSDQSVHLDDTRVGPELGLDLHAIGSAWADVDEDAADDPDAALSQLADLALGALRLQGYAPDDPVALSGAEPEVVRAYSAARETAERAELGEASRSEVETAIADLREVLAAVVGLRE